MVSRDPSTERAARRLTAIFAKRPEPGRVKTRLVPPLSPADAAGLAEAMLADALERGEVARGAFRTRLCYAPAGAERWFRKRFPGSHELAPQRGPGLAERLAAFFADALAEEAVDTAVALGSDAPRLTAARIAEAHRRLEGGADVVLGPDLGGGYYLVGLRHPHPELFTAVEMSTDGMCTATAVLAREEGLAVELLEPEYDVDVETDLERLRADLARDDPEAPDFPRHTAALLPTLLPGP